MATVASLGSHGYIGDAVSSLVLKQGQELLRKTPIRILWSWLPRERWATYLSQDQPPWLTGKPEVLPRMRLREIAEMPDPGLSEDTPTHCGVVEGPLASALGDPPPLQS